MGSDHDDSGDVGAESMAPYISTIISELIHILSRSSWRWEDTDSYGSGSVLPRTARFPHGTDVNVYGIVSGRPSRGEAYDYTITQSPNGIQLSIHRRR